MCGRHERSSSHGGDIEGVRVVPVYEVTCPAQMHEVGHFVRRHVLNDI
jgi:hypothetical protein